MKRFPVCSLAASAACAQRERLNIVATEPEPRLERCSATGFLGTPGRVSLSPRVPAGRGRSLRRAIYPRCLLKKAATGSKEELVERFSLST